MLYYYGLAFFGLRPQHSAEGDGLSEILFAGTE